ncbi:MAG: hypothetical protein MUD08_16115 [Cytophagales bacterium]|nr:hypothetical protein [Cytophagales bacterium]
MGTKQKSEDSTKKKDSTEKKDEKQYGANSDTDRNDRLNGLGDFTFNGFKVIPNVKILASRVRMSDNTNERRHCFYTAAELFILPNYATFEPTEYRANFFIPEISNYGFQLSLAYANLEKGSGYETKKFIPSVFLNANILSKGFRKDTFGINKDFSSLVCHLNAGAEVVIPESYVSFYGGINWVCTLAGRQDFRENLATPDMNFLFFNAGIRAELNLTENNNTLALDIGFLGQSGVVSDFVRNKDAVIPQIRIGFRHSLLQNPKLVAGN